MANNIDDPEFIEHCRNLAKEINKINDFETVVLEYYTTIEDQKTMLIMGFVGDFAVRELPCEKVEKPYITYDEYLENEFQNNKKYSFLCFSKTHSISYHNVP